MGLGNSVQSVVRWVRSNGFLFGLIGMLGLAWMLPDLGARGGFLQSEVTRRIAVFVIFFVQGLSLPVEEIRRGLARLDLHCFVLGWNYLLFPLIVFGGILLSGSFLSPEIRFGFVYLGLLPTTITSAVFFTSAARGDVAGAVFSTAISNLISVVIVPLGAAWLLFGEARGEVSIVAMFSKLCVLIVLPMAIGQGLRPLLKTALPTIKPWFKKVTSSAIFFIMYCTFCDGVKSAVWEALGWGALLSAVLGAVIVLGIVSGLVWWSSRLCGLSGDSRVAAFYCGSQKSLATGVPMAVSIFPDGGMIPGIPALSIIVLPLMCYHFFQLALASRVADRFVRLRAE